jgi:dTMP kinase
MTGSGYLLTVEGIDGAGKSSQARILAGRLRELGREVVETREPGGSPGVLCDRYVDSTRAYQGAGAPERRALADRLHLLAIGLDPDLTLIFDIDPAAALKRAQLRLSAQDEDRFEKMGLAFQARLRAEFLAIASAEPGRCALINAAQTPEAVAGQVWAAVAPRVGLSP